MSYIDTHTQTHILGKHPNLRMSIDKSMTKGVSRRLIHIYVLICVSVYNILVKLKLILNVQPYVTVHTCKKCIWMVNNNNINDNVNPKDTICWLRCENIILFYFINLRNSNLSIRWPSYVYNERKESVYDNNSDIFYVVVTNTLFPLLSFQQIFRFKVFFLQTM